MGDGVEDADPLVEEDVPGPCRLLRRLLRTDRRGVLSNTSKLPISLSDFRLFRNTNLYARIVRLVLVRTVWLILYLRN